MPNFPSIFGRIYNLKTANQRERERERKRGREDQLSKRHKQIETPSCPHHTLPHPLPLRVLCTCLQKHTFLDPISLRSYPGSVRVISISNLFRTLARHRVAK